MNGHLAEVVQPGLVDEVKATPLPARFTVVYDRLPIVRITDTRTGRKAVVSLYAAAEVFKSLDLLFGSDVPDKVLERNSVALVEVRNIKNYCAGLNLNLFRALEVVENILEGKV